MLERRVFINKKRCNGCGLCVEACHEGAIALVEGKAQLVRENFCDGLGDCLPACPRRAITFRDPEPSPGMPVAAPDPSACLMAEPEYQWPIQIALVPPRSNFFRGILVVGTDCTAFTIDGFRERFVSGNPVIIGCPKLDDRSRFNKLATILSRNPIDSVSVVRMEVPCCRVISNLVVDAAEASGRGIGVDETVVSRRGSVISCTKLR